MRFVEANRASSISIDLPRRPSAAGTYVVADRQGGVLQASAAASLDAVNTTLGASADAGALSVVVTSASGITVGRRYLLAGAEDAGGEVVTVRSISSTTITLARRILTARASGVSFASSRVTFALPALPSPDRAYRVEYTYPVADDRPSVAVPFDVTRWTPVTSLTLEDVRDIDPLVVKRLPAGLWLPALRDDAWEMLCRHIATRIDPGAVVGTIDLTVAHGYLVRALLAESAGDGPEVTAYRERMATRYAEERDGVLGTLAVDRGQTGAASLRDAWTRHLPIMRG